MAVALDRLVRPLADVATVDLLVELQYRDLEAADLAREAEALDLATLHPDLDLEDLRRTWQYRLERDQRSWLQGIPDEELAAEHEALRYLNLTFGVPSEERRIVASKARLIAQEIARRKRLRDTNAGRGGVPDEPVRDLTLTHRIAEAHRRYPIDRFCTDLLHVKLTPSSNGRLKGLCPFHQERTPSFVVYPEGRAKCYGCHAGGDIFDLTRLYFRTESFYAALQQIEATY